MCNSCINQQKLIISVTLEAPGHEDMKKVRKLHSGSVNAGVELGKNDGEPKCGNVHSWQVVDECFELDSRYAIVDYLGAGAYGVVCAAYDNFEKRVVAIKKCRKIFQSRTMAKRTLRELRILRLLNHENIVKIISILRPQNVHTFSEIYVEFELMETDLASIIRSSQPLRDQHVQFFTFQILNALKYLHSMNIVHRDLKPRNILVNSNCDLKIADFGLARVYSVKTETKTLAMTEYVTTRWYRAPEVLVGWHKYTTAVDIWAVGTILAEMLGRKPLFPGSDSLRQLELIAKCMGKPPESFIQLCRKPLYRHFLRELSDTRPTPFSILYPTANPLVLDLLKRMLDIIPDRRIGAGDCLKHPYIAPMTSRSSVDSPLPCFPVSEFYFEDHKAEIPELRYEMLREVSAYHPEMALSLCPCPYPTDDGGAATALLDGSPRPSRAPQTVLPPRPTDPNKRTVFVREESVPMQTSEAAVGMGQRKPLGGGGAPSLVSLKKSIGQGQGQSETVRPYQNFHQSAKASVHTQSQSHGFVSRNNPSQGNPEVVCTSSSAKKNLEKTHYGKRMVVERAAGGQMLRGDSLPELSKELHGTGAGIGMGSDGDPNNVHSDEFAMGLGGGVGGERFPGISLATRDSIFKGLDKCDDNMRAKATEQHSPHWKNKDSCIIF
eukprot:gene1846-3581_t